jgi:dihydrodipicolinate synthase/N-acetylneuraminate lyase
MSTPDSDAGAGPGPGPSTRPRPGPGIRGALAAAATPLRDGGEALDEGAFDPLVAFLAKGGLDGILALGTTGEGILLSPQERRRAVERFVRARPAGFAVVVHCGAQATAETAALAAHAAESGADAVAVIGPPYFELDPASMLAHFRAAAAACAPLPFYVYEFAARSGYAVPVPVVQELRAVAPNLRGLKVSDSPFDRVRPYLLEGLDVFVGSEPLTLEAMEHGAVGTVSGVATAFPEPVARLVRERSPESQRTVTRLRELLAPLPFHAAVKAVLARRGVPVRPDVRAPLRGLSDDERDRALAALDEVAATGALA